ncbi:hypothetical protein PoB_004743500 [Plakobranchus ocellatus]|uniref:Uncharacterized protein n=1 Tax=Plakobranchus ocellatus TaxID=259542 RepID=A0AAV4BNB0_9GAST|nr:hypothetical protein PoB_004743500 [Plakobranchus ocellatus]
MWEEEEEEKEEGEDEDEKRVRARETVARGGREEEEEEKSQEEREQEQRLSRGREGSGRKDSRAGVEARQKRVMGRAAGKKARAGVKESGSEELHEEKDQEQAWKHGEKEQGEEQQQ